MLNQSKANAAWSLSYAHTSQHHVMDVHWRDGTKIRHPTSDRMYGARRGECGGMPNNGLNRGETFIALLTCIDDDLANL